jgi:ferredoxin
MTEAIQEAERLGWPAETIHFERFGAPLGAADEPFLVVARRSGKDFEVGATQSVLDCLEASGIHVEAPCRAGSCGSCETRVLNGDLIQRDSVLTPQQRAACNVMMVCVSRARGPLVLDI